MTTHSWDGYNRQPGGRIDKRSASLVSISEEHWVVHQGIAYHAGHKFTGVLTTNSVDLLIKVPAGKYPHLHLLDLYAGRGDIDLLLYEGATVSADGTSVPLLNLNRASSNTASSTIFHTPTVTDPGSLLGRT